MSDVNSNSKHVKDSKNDGNDDDKQKPRHHTFLTRPLHQRTIILLLVVLVILLIGSYMLFRPPVSHSINESSQTLEQDSTSATSSSKQSSGYQTIAGPPVSTQTTESMTKGKANKTRVEVPGDVIDKITANSDIKSAQKNNKNGHTTISALEKSGAITQSAPAVLRASASIQKKVAYKELPLFKTIEKEHYTIQLNGSTLKKNLETYAKQNRLSNFQIYQTIRQNAPWFVILKGNYPTVEDAKVALKVLPEKLKSVNPWIRSGKSFQLLQQ